MTLREFLLENKFKVKNKQISLLTISDEGNIDILNYFDVKNIKEKYLDMIVEETNLELEDNVLEMWIMEEK